MDDFIEIVFDLILNGCIDTLPNRKIPKWIRVILSVFLFGVIFGIILLGVVVIQDSVIGGIFILLVGLFLLIGSIIEIRKHMK